jgi:hypothetical protein
MHKIWERQKMFTLIIVIIKSINTFQKRHNITLKNLLVSLNCNEVNQVWRLYPNCHMVILTNKPPQKPYPY